MRRLSENASTMTASNFSFRERAKQKFQSDRELQHSPWANGYQGTGGSSFRNYPRGTAGTVRFPGNGVPRQMDQRSPHLQSAGVVNLPKGHPRSRLFFSTVRRDRSTSPTQATTLNIGEAVPLLESCCPKQRPDRLLAYAGNNAGARDCSYGLTGPSTCTVAKYEIRCGATSSSSWIRGSARRSSFARRLRCSSSSRPSTSPTVQTSAETTRATSRVPPSQRRPGSSRLRAS